MNFIYKSHEEISPSCALAIGNFDGLHCGHQQLFKKIRDDGHSVAVLTFWPNPRMYFNQNFIPMHSIEEKIDSFEQIGVDRVFILNFNHKFAEMSAEIFIQDILLSGMKPRSIYIGEDFRFGKNAQGDAFYMQKSLDGAINVNIAQLYDKETYSSTKARFTLLNGDFDVLNNILGRKYYFIGIAAKTKNKSIEILRDLKLNIKDIEFLVNVSYKAQNFVTKCYIKGGVCFLRSLPENCFEQKVIITPLLSK